MEIYERDQAIKINQLAQIIELKLTWSWYKANMIFYKITFLSQIP